jgi:UPF0755 protein
MGRFLKILTTVLSVLTVVGGGGVFWGYSQFKGSGPLADGVTVIIKRGSGAKAIARDLHQAGVLSGSWVLRVAARMSAGGPLKAGEYAFPPAISPEGVLRTLQGGKTVVRRVTFAEGLTTAEILSQLALTEGLMGIVTAVPAEGALLPETYHFSYGDKRQAIVGRMSASLQDQLADLWAKRAPGLPLDSPRDALILASIVERETARPAERPRIAQVFLNRLAKGMRLQSDPTVVYGLMKRQRPLSRPLTIADLKVPSPFNTYLIGGLPPSPICNPGSVSLESVLRPAQSEELYFVADGAGGHLFAKTLKEHNLNVARWRKIRTKQKNDRKKSQ